MESLLKTTFYNQVYIQPKSYDLTDVLSQNFFDHSGPFHGTEFFRFVRCCSVKLPVVISAIF